VKVHLQLCEIIIVKEISYYVFNNIEGTFSISVLKKIKKLICMLKLKLIIYGLTLELFLRDTHVYILYSRNLFALISQVSLWTYNLRCWIYETHLLISVLILYLIEDKTFEILDSFDFHIFHLLISLTRFSSQASSSFISLWLIHVLFR
jgi:hypothetical protein